MGDISSEPSMEEILSSIKRIIAEEETPTGRRRAPPRPAPESRGEEDEDGEVLELSDPMQVLRPALQPVPEPVPEPVAFRPRPEEPPIDVPSAPPVPEPRAERLVEAYSDPQVTAPSQPAAASQPAPAEPVGLPPAEPILSPAAVDATRGSLDSLSRMLVKPDPQGDGTLEGLVRDMLRPMLKEWLDATLPDMVERMVAQEIARISGRP